MGQHWGTVGAFIVGGSHVGWQETTIQVSFTAVDPSVVAAALNDELLAASLNLNLKNVIVPVAYIYAVHRDTGVKTRLSNCTGFTVQMKKNNRIGSADLQFGNPIETNTRTPNNLGLLSAKWTYFIQIEAGYKIEGVDYVVPIFKGLQQRVMEQYSKGGGSIQIYCDDIMEGLNRIPGEVTSYTGSAKTLITQFATQAKFSGVTLNFTDFNFSSQDFNQDTALELINVIAKKYGSIFIYTDGSGNFIMTPSSTETTTEFSYQTGQNIFTVQNQYHAQDLTNKVVVNGQGIYLVREDLTSESNYGVMDGDIQSNLIQTQAEAEAAADRVILDSYKRQLNIQIPFNPYLQVDSVISVDCPTAEINEQVCRVTGVTHYFSTSEKSKSLYTYLALEQVETPITNLQTTEVA